MVEFKMPSAPAGAMVVIPGGRPGMQLVEHGIRRTTSLQAPIMQLTGHDGEIFTGKFNPDGTALASAGYDRHIFLWNVYGECENFSVLNGHTGPVLEIQFSPDGSVLNSCSADKSVRLWDMYTGAVIRRLKGHQAIVNSVACNRRGPHMLCTGSDDGTLKVWDARSREPVHSFQNTYQATAVSFNDTGEQVVAGGIDNDLKVWDLRTKEMSLRMRGHTDTVTGISLSPDGAYILSNSMDNTVRVWDIRPYAPDFRCVTIFQGHQHNFEKNLLRCAWSPNGSRISAGSADRYVYVWDVATRRLLYKLPGHNGSVNQTDFHPKENILLSVSSDKKLYLGELD